ncbi:MAG TPA: N-methyl-L-tryptophan oxidase [Candidatus Krumholzibacteria bacterium]|nr:N-methyl-L-tryptophan oxidase [Candidatus Krumholzibacteria bacterium]
MKPFDAAVVGLGAMGSAALCHLARRGARVVGFDAYTPPHALGSSHGETRMIREAYYEDARYVPLLRRAYALWHDLARDAATELIVETGGIFAGPPDAELVAGVERAGREHGIAVERLDGAALAARAPWLRLPSDMVALSEARAGLLHPERCIDAHLRLAVAAGASIHADESVIAWRASGDGVVVETKSGRYPAARLILCAGAGMTAWLADAGVAATVTRQPMFWFTNGRDAASLNQVWAIQIDGERLLYGFPDVGGGLKAAIHYGGAPTTWQSVDRAVSADEARETADLLARFLPGVHGDLLRAVACIYTNTKDHHFAIDAHPAHANVLVVSACSGHGFKFASAIGEASSQWALDGAWKLDLSLFSLDRLRAGP